jgi:hypothetical protein
MGWESAFALPPHRNTVQCIQDQLRRDKITQPKNGLAQCEGYSKSLTSLSHTTLRSSYMIYKILTTTAKPLMTRKQ